MKFQIAKKELLEALKGVQPAVANRSTLPILGGIKLEAGDGLIRLEATDLELAIRLEVPAETPDGHGQAVVPAKSFIKAVKALADSTVTVEIHDANDRRTVDVSCEKRKVAIESYSVDDWPDIAADVEWKPLFRVEASDLADVLGRVALCASSDDSRPIITGIQFNLNDSERRAAVVATDSYRLGVANLDVELIGEAPGSSPILPARVLKALAKELKGRDGRAVLHLGTAGQPDHQRTLVEFSFGEISWVMRQIQGEFPNWKALVPDDSAGSTFEYDSKELSTAVKGASELRSSKTTPVRLVLSDSCALRMVDGQVETTTETLEGATYRPDGVGALEIAFDPDFLLNGISFIGNGRGLMRITDGAKPALFIGDDDSRYLLMPVRTK
jgi:DNA polymerase III subunit beta